MGFSTAGSTALLVLGLFIAFGTFQAATTERLEHVTDAKHAAGEDRLDRINTEINVTEATWDGTTITIEATNNGTTTLSLDDTDVVIDNTYIESGALDTETVDGDGSTSLWLPGETYHLEITDPTFLGPTEDPQRVSIVTERGIAASRDIKETGVS